VVDLVVDRIIRGIQTIRIVYIKVITNRAKKEKKDGMARSPNLGSKTWMMQAKTTNTEKRNTAKRSTAKRSTAKRSTEKRSTEKRSKTTTTVKMLHSVVKRFWTRRLQIKLNH